MNLPIPTAILIDDHLVDDEKKKYFKILPNHAAPPNSKYSRENVQKEKEQSKVSLFRSRTSQIARSRVHERIIMD